MSSMGVNKIISLVLKLTPFNHYKLCLIFLVLFHCSGESVGQSTDVLKTVLKDYVDASRSNDYEKSVSLHHNIVTDIYGGPQAMTVFVRNITDQLIANGLSIDTIIVGVPGTVNKVDTDFFSLTSITSVLKTPVNFIELRSFMLAISSDQGVHWSLVPVNSKITFDTVSKAFPNLTKQLQIPEIPDPIIHNSRPYLP